MGLSRGQKLVGACAVLLVVALVVWWAWPRRPAEPLQVNAPQGADDDKDLGGEARGADDDYVVIGGVRRRRADVEPKRPEAKPTDAKEDSPFRDPGSTPAIPADANPSVASVVEAIRERTHPERLSPLVAPAPYDREAFAADPETYLQTVEPGRVFQTAQPGEDVPRLQRLSPYRQEVTQGESTILEVRATPGAPVTFTTFDLGQFQNRLTSVTVQAGDDGIVRAEFLATPGTVNNVNILAGSPETSGQVKFVVRVQLP